MSLVARQGFATLQAARVRAFRSQGQTLNRPFARLMQRRITVTRYDKASRNQLPRRYSSRFRHQLDDVMERFRAFRHE